MAVVLESLPRLPFPLAVGAAVLSLALSILSTTYVQHVQTLRWLRLLLAFPIGVLWLNVMYPAEDYGKNIGLTAAAWGQLGLYRMIDICVVGFWDAPSDVPRWVKVEPPQKESEADGQRGASTGLRKRAGRVVLPLPETPRERVIYTVDYFFAARGGSFYSGRAWTWTPESRLLGPQPGYINFLKRQLGKIFKSIIAIDLLDNILMSTGGIDRSRRHPILTLPLPQQLVYSLAVGIHVGVSQYLIIDNIATYAYIILRIPPETWKPHYGADVWSTHSLAQLWTDGWHVTFRRVFMRMSTLIVDPFKSILPAPVVRIYRLFVIFAFSAAFHAAIPLVLVGHDRSQDVTNGFWDWPMIAFFLAQPLGILFEGAVVNPLTESLPGRWKTWARRIWFWMWILGTGRGYADSYIKWGPYDRLALGPNTPFSYVFHRLFPLQTS